MIRPTPEDLEVLAMAARNARFVDFIQRWMIDELRQLPARQTNVPLFQGRAQVLQEIHEALIPAAAKQPTKT